ncbi:KaiC domain-containing protein [Candidatus Bathyarchaeota archaeon]|nr:KaiC domain-containing protein [Candidatus Bathyarchaeota archaeon]
MEHVPTGIDGLDKMLNDGLPTGRCILVCGGPGSGKTILSMQFLRHGAIQCNESGLYVSLDEDIGQLKEEMAGFGWDLEKLEEKGKLAIVDASPIRHIPKEVKVGDLWVGKRNFSSLSLIEIVKKNVEKINAKRIVIDPITALTLQYPDISERRTAILDLFEALSNLGTTNLITTELRSVTLERKIRAEEFLAHGVIVLHVFMSDKEIVRGIQIEKMRGIAHDDQIRPYKITEKGIEVFSQEKSLIATPITSTLQV